MKRRLTNIVLVLNLLGCLPARAQTAFRYDRLPKLPGSNGQPNPGVAGAFAGMSHGALLVAGGANFPNGYPWQNGTKVWQSTIYVLPLTGKSLRWQQAGRLKKPLAYGASVSWQQRLICLGGNDATQRYADVFALTWDAATRQVRTEALPSLPRALANLSVAVLGDDLYVFGGESDRGAEKGLYVLNLKKPESGWQTRPVLPGPARAFTAMTALSGALYVLGGRQTVDGETTVFRDAYVYRPSQNRWSVLPDLPVTLAAHTAGAVGANSLLIFGGDDGLRLKQIERLNNQISPLPDGPAKVDLTRQRNNLQTDHPGFRREVWQFRTNSRAWSVVDTLPFLTPVTTPLVAVPGGFILPSGEVSPGVRTPASWRIRVQQGN